jgi:hypothetical protein
MQANPQGRPTSRTCTQRKYEHMLLPAVSKLLLEFGVAALFAQHLDVLQNKRAPAKHAAL